jgi:uncharacterized protein (DUF1778 family)
VTAPTASFHLEATVMSDLDKRQILAAAASLRNVTSIRDFIVAVQSGAQVALDMLDQMENSLVEVLEKIEDGP